MIRGVLTFACPYGFNVFTGAIVIQDVKAILPGKTGIIYLF